MPTLSAARDAGSAAARRPDRPAPPRWRDRRLVVGVLLVAASVVLGGRLVAAADQRVAVWSLRHDLAAGAVVSDDDLAVARVALDTGLERYVGADQAPSGRRLSRPVSSGELLPVAALVAPDASPRRLVTVPVEPLHAPVGLAAGERVELWVTPRDNGEREDAPRRVLPSVVVADVADDPDAFGAATEIAVVLDVPASDAAAAVAAVRQGSIDLVRVPGGMP